MSEIPLEETTEVPQIEPPTFTDDELAKMSPQEREEARLRKEMDDARDELFAQNQITPEMVAAWKEQYADVGWTSFIVPGIEHGVIFVYRVIRRNEWKRNIKGHFSQAKVVDPDDQNEYIASYGTLHPQAAHDPLFWADEPALMPDTLSSLIMDVSGGDTLTPAMRL
jgi:hypothetical protein